MTHEKEVVDQNTIPVKVQGKDKTLMMDEPEQADNDLFVDSIQRLIEMIFDELT